MALIRRLSASIQRLQPARLATRVLPVSSARSSLGTRYSHAASSAPQTQITKLSNGITVASQDDKSLWGCLGVYVDSGFRNEEPSTLGSTFALEKLAFQGLNETNTDLGTLQCQAGKEGTLYSSFLFRNDIEAKVALFANVITNPSFSHDDFLDLQRPERMTYEYEQYMNKPAAFTMDLLHKAAYGPNDLGQGMIDAHPDVIANLTLESVLSFQRSNYVGSRIVISSFGLDHQLLCNLVEKYFGNLPKGSPRTVSTKNPYVGGPFHYPLEESNSNNALQIPLTQVMLGFPSESWSHPNAYARAVLYILLGGGGSFSAGGPGKGMYSRLYRNVLASHYEIETAVATNTCYSETGIFSLQGACPPAFVSSLIPILIRSLRHVCDYVGKVEFQRAKNQLKSSLLMNLEAKGINVEDIARQVAVTGHHLSADELCAKIDSVTVDDIQTICKEMLYHSQLSYSVYGSMEGVPDYEDVVKMISSATA